MKLLMDYSSAELRKIISLKEQIEALQAQLTDLSGQVGSTPILVKSRRGPRHMSASARRKISLAQKARWAKQSATGSAAPIRKNAA